MKGQKENNEVEQNCSSALTQVGKDVQKASTVMNQESVTSQLWIPFALTFVYLYALKLTTQGWPEEISTFSHCSILVPIFGCIIYLTAVYLGVKFMKNREPFSLKSYMFTYNLYQSLLNLWCVYSFIMEIYNNGLSIWGNTSETTTYKMSFLIWIHYNNKYVELLDTAFMILRKKDNQLSFLHIYHHALVMWCWWFVCHFACWGDAYFGAMMNSFIHVVMYSYYLFSLLNIPCPWKKYLTQMQLVQFVLCFVSATYCAVMGTYPLFLCMIQIFVMVNMLVLFSNFYRKNYSDSSRTKTE